MGFLNLFGIGKRRKMIEEVLASGAIVIDVRTREEYNQGHAANSVNVPLDVIAGKVKKLKKLNKPLVLCCASGMRSGTAVSILKKQGIECYNAGRWTRIS